MELDRLQGALKLLARVEAGQDVADQVGANFLGGIHTFAGAPQPEAAEIAQFHDVALRQFGGDNSEEAFDRCHHIDRCQRGHLCRPLCQLTRRHAPTGLNGGIELLGGSPVCGVRPFNCIVFNRHFP